MSDDATIRLIEKDAVREHIMRTARLLDEEALEDWLALFSEDGTYEIRAYGTEIRADMVWWRSTYAELAGILKEARDHVRDPARRLHLVSPVSVEVSADRAEALSHFQVTRTDPDGVRQYLRRRPLRRFPGQGKRPLALRLPSGGSGHPHAGFVHAPAPLTCSTWCRSRTPGPTLFPLHAESW